MRKIKFTLIELISVIVILAILAVFVSANPVNDNADLRFAVKLIRADIRFIQSLSLSNDNNSDLYQINFVNGEYRLARASSVNTVPFPGTESTTRTISGIAISANTGSIVFSTFGAPDTDLLITVTDRDGNSETLTIDNVTGSITESL